MTESDINHSVPIFSQEDIDTIHNQYAEYFEELNTEEIKHSHYFKDVSRLKWLDVYMLGHLFNVQDHGTGCLTHALKKIVVSGQRGYKDQSKDVQEAIDTLTRYLAILKEIDLGN
jgi:hypothetical protein